MTSDRQHGGRVTFDLIPKGIWEVTQQTSTEPPLPEHTLLLPERRGNSRVEGLRNLLADPRSSLVFSVPGASGKFWVTGMAS